MRAWNKLSASFVRSVRGEGRYSDGGNLFNWYALGGRSFNSPYGTYSISDDITNWDEPKELAFKSVRDMGLGG